MAKLSLLDVGDDPPAVAVDDGEQRAADTRVTSFAQVEVGHIAVGRIAPPPADGIIVAAGGVAVAPADGGVGDVVAVAVEQAEAAPEVPQRPAPALATRDNSIIKENRSCFVEIGKNNIGFFGF